MAAYTAAATVGRKHTVKPITTRRYKITEAGTVRGSSLASDDAYRITVQHPYITSAQMTTLQTWYDTNKDADNTIDIDGDTYDVNCESDYERETVSASYMHARITLIGTRQ